MNHAPPEEKKGKREGAKEAGKKKEGERSKQERKKKREKEEEGRRENKKNSGGRFFGERLSRTRVGARIPTAILFFYCHKCHTWGKTRKIGRENAGKMREIPEKDPRENPCFSMLSSVLRKRCLIIY